MTAFAQDQRNEESQRVVRPAANPVSRMKMIKEHCKTAKRRMAGLIAAGLREMSFRPVSTGFGVLMYHRITPRTKGISQPTWNVTPDRFYQQLAGLIQLGYEPKPLKQVLGLHTDNKPIPPNWFVVTFDDIYANVFTNAFPILKKLNIPATVFLATKYLDQRTPFPFDDWPHSGAPGVSEAHWKPVTTLQCLEMQESELIELGAHTHSHEDFRNRPDDLYEDLQICQEELFSRFGVEKPTFAFPYGTKHLGFSGPVLAAAAEKAGLLCSLTTEDVQVTAESSPFDWGRFTAEQFDTPRTLAAKLDGSFSKAKQTWQRISSPFKVFSSHS